MQLNPRITQLLEGYEPERLKALLAWFLAEVSQTVSANPFAAALLAVESLDAPSCYQLMSSDLVLEDVVKVSILNEFGPEFTAKKSFHWLDRTMRHRFAERYAVSN
jgi:hypothetical protein